MALTADTLVRCGVPREKAQAHLPLLTAGMREFGITTQLRGQFYLAEIMEESGAFKWFQELASGAEYEGRRDLGNVHRGDGPRYKGRGPIQLTGRSNYRFYGHLLGLDLEGHPDLAALPRIGFRTAAAYFQHAGCNGRADHNDFVGCTRLINAALRGMDERKRYLRLLHGRDCTPGAAGIARGEKGDAVIVLTRRLSYVHSPRTNAPYLNGRRSTFDRDTAIALKRFQRDNHLKPTGIFDPHSQRVLARRVAQRKALRHAPRPAAPIAPASAPHAPPAKEPPVPHKHRPTAELVAELARVDDRRERLMALLVYRGRHLEHLLKTAAFHPKAQPAGLAATAGTPPDLHDLYDELGRLSTDIEAVRAAIATSNGEPS